LLASGIDERNLVLDPGFGFAKRPDHSWRLLAELPRLVDLGYPVLVGTSRKRFLAQVVPGSTGDTPASPAARDDATAATSTLAAAAGAWAVRVHEAAASAAAVRVVQAVRESLDG
jgi:dihydropteroate synthase